MSATGAASCLLHAASPGPVPASPDVGPSGHCVVL
eukprot:CAMPEP_0179409422 /NCGR_PEP_ID=MMETSP0799-20121207/2695_1 /TAXON_ID=46947 /ORGANISM="Geminigera cryophila, Strain CCMP2564" /LENGTH=34 /DNA_ID= /DNA_START= /DNA_END= /DNA_ORIENTATION=